MAVKLRLKRMGKKRQPIYKVVAADVRSPRDGRFIEAIGLYNPKTNPATVEIHEERALYWLSVGAQPTDTVKNLLSREGILLKNDLIKQGLSEEVVAAKMDEWYKARAEKIAKSVKSETEKKVVAEDKAEEPREEVKEEETAVEEAKEVTEEIKEEATDAASESPEEEKASE